MRAWRRVRWVLGLAAMLLSTGVLLLPASPAQAHATLVDTNPPNGTALGEAPEEIRLRFSERITVAPDGVSLREADGGAVTTDPATVPEDDPTSVVLPVPPDLPDGSYIVTFRIVSADSHPVSGALVFGVGVPAGSLAEVEIETEDAAVAAAFTVARWSGYAGLALLAGTLCVFVLCWPAGWSNPRARRLVLAGWVASLFGAAAGLLLQGPYGAGRSLLSVADPALLSGTLTTDYGRYLLVRLGLVVAAGVLLYAGHRWPARVRAGGALAVGVALPATWVGTGHANTAANRFDLVADVTHLVAMSTWFGGLAVLAICLLPRGAGLPLAEVAPALRRFSLLATGAVITIVVTGVYLAWQRVGTVDAMFGTAYGRLLAFKIAILGILLWLGALSRGVVKRRYATELAIAEGGKPAGNSKRAAADEQAARTRLRQSVRLEVVTAVAVLAVASALVATPPGVVVTAADAQAAAPTGNPVLDEAQIDDEGGVLLLVDPAWVGENRLVLEMVDMFGNPREVPEIRAAFVLPEEDLGPLPAELVEIAPAVYEATGVQLPVAGQWRLDITVRTTEIDSTTVRVDVPIG